MRDGVVADADRADPDEPQLPLQAPPRPLPRGSVRVGVLGRRIIEPGPVHEREVQRGDAESRQDGVHGAVGVAHLAGGDLAGEKRRIRETTRRGGLRRGVGARRRSGGGAEAREAERVANRGFVAVARRGVHVRAPGVEGGREGLGQPVAVEAEGAQGEAGHVHAGGDLHGARDARVGHGEGRAARACRRQGGGERGRAHGFGSRRDSRTCVSAAYVTPIPRQYPRTCAGDRGGQCIAE